MKFNPENIELKNKIAFITAVPLLNIAYLGEVFLLNKIFILKIVSYILITNLDNGR